MGGWIEVGTVLKAMCRSGQYVEVRKVRGHAKARGVHKGLVLSIDKFGNDAADKLACAAMP